MTSHQASGSGDPTEDSTPPDRPGSHLPLKLLGLLVAVVLVIFLVQGKVVGKGPPVVPLPGVSSITGFTGKNARLFFRADDPRLVFNGKQLNAGEQKIFIAHLSTQEKEGSHLNLPTPGSGYAFVYFPSRGWLASFANDTAPYLSEENPGSVISVLSDRRGRALRFEGLDELSGESSFTYVAEPLTPQVPPRKTSTGGPAG
jgi:hypothetical protein